jgi:microcystin-dependent protein
MAVTWKKLAFFDEIGGSGGDPVGSLMMWPLDTVPSGYLECNGASLLRADYSDLYTAIGTIYGTADGTHFTLPDFRGRFPRAWAHGQADDPDRASRSKIAATGATMTAGDHVGTEQANAFKSHTHSISTGSDSSDYGYVAQAPTVTHPDAATTGAPSTGSTTNETRPENTYVMICIKY